MTDEEITKLMTQCCDKDKVPAFQNGFWVVTQEELTRFARRLVHAEITELKRTWLSPETYKTLMKERQETLHELSKLQAKNNTRKGTK